MNIACFWKAMFSYTIHNMSLAGERFSKGGYSCADGRNLIGGWSSAGQSSTMGGRTILI